MSPLRLVVLGILLYILFRLLLGGRTGARSKARPSGQSRDLPSHDVLVEDPVCHTFVPQKQAVTLKNDNTVYHFCSEKCRASFLAQKGESR